jgi:3-hydroxyisobutyrate dehydrogenase-like beta-hydroxyacid dehydrogenase
MSIAFLGTGLLGSGFVEHLLATTGGVSVWNRTASKAARFAEAGARVAATPAEAVAGAARIHLCLHSDEAVDQVLDALVPGADRQAVIIDHTTTSPDGAAARGARLAADGRAFLHAPVFMSPSHARDAKGIMLCSGPEDVFARVDAALAAMTGDLWYQGPDLRKSAGMKLAGNAMLIAIAAGLADTLALGRATGLTSDDVMAVLDRLKPGGAIAIRGKRMAAGDFKASFELAMARKDVGLMLDAVGTAPLSVLPGIAARADALVAAGHGTDDLGVLAIDAVRR